jgi:hypothetical protein
MTAAMGFRPPERGSVTRSASNAKRRGSHSDHVIINGTTGRTHRQNPLAMSHHKSFLLLIVIDALRSRHRSATPMLLFPILLPWAEATRLPPYGRAAT